MKKIITVLLCVLLSFKLIAQETLTFRLSNPHIEYYSPDNYLVFDVLVKASANATYLYASQVIFNINLANFNTAIPPSAEKGFTAGTYDPPGPILAQEKYQVYANYNAGNLNIAVLANVNFNNYMVPGHSEITTDWQTLCTVYCAVSNTAGVAGISFQPSAMNGYQKFAISTPPLYSAYYASPNVYEGDNFNELYLNRIYSGGSGWTQAGGSVNWASSVNTSVWDTQTTAAVAGTSAMANNLRIHKAGQLIINPGSSLTVASTLINNANVGNNGLVIKSDATGTASLINNSAGVSATVKRYLPKYFEVPDLKFHFISSPVTAQVIQPEFIDITIPYDDVTPTLTDFYSFDEGANMWINARGGWNASYNTWNPDFELNFKVGKGYMVAYPTDITKTFAGTLNSSVGVLNCTNTGSGWNLLGNPFPSAIDWDKVELGDGMGKAVYYYENATPKYVSYINVGGVGLGEGQPYIPAMQGFMVYAEPTGTKTVTIPTLAKTHQGQDVFYKSTTSIPGSLSIKVTANDYDDEAFIHFNQGATTAFDGSYDAFKLKSYSDKVPMIFTKGSDDSELSINGLPELDASTVIPVYLEAANEGPHTLTANLDGLPDAVVNLVDMKLNTTQNLKENPVYNFNTENGDDVNRFKLTFTSVGIEKPKATEGAQVYAFDNVLYVETIEKESALVSVYNLTGQLVMQGKTGGNTLSTFNASALGNGVYVVNVILNEGVVSRKVVIRK